MFKKISWLDLSILALIFRLVFYTFVFQPQVVEAKDQTNKVALLKLDNVVNFNEVLKNTPDTVNIDLEIGKSLIEERKEQEQIRLEQIKRQQEQQSVLKTKTLRIVRSIKPATSGNESVDRLIEAYAAQNNIVGKTDQVKRIVFCESKGDPSAKNRTSTAGGLAQYLDRTWVNTPEGQAGLSKYDPNAALSALTRDISLGLDRKWNASASCWAK